MEQYIVKGFSVRSQDPLVPGRRSQSITLPVLLKAMQLVETVTGHRWRVTSFLRASPSHSKGISLDIAPDIASSSRRFYSVFRRSDPVLFKRGVLMRQLKRIPRRFFNDSSFAIGFFVETDHIHIQLFDRADPSFHGVNGFVIAKWKCDKSSVYPDSRQRQAGVKMLN